MKTITKENALTQELNAGAKIYTCRLCKKKYSEWGKAYTHGLKEVGRYGLSILKIVSLFV